MEWARRVTHKMARELRAYWLMLVWLVSGHTLVSHSRFMHLAQEDDSHRNPDRKPCSNTGTCTQPFHLLYILSLTFVKGIRLKIVNFHPLPCLVLTPRFLTLKCRAFAVRKCSLRRLITTSPEELRSAKL